MAAIGSIRKHGVFLMIIIGVALLAFIIGDLTNVVNFGRNTVMQVGSKKIEAGPNENTYSEYYQQNYEYLKMMYSNNPLYSDNSALLDQTAHEFTYQQVQHEIVLDEQLKKIGLSFTDEMKAEVSEKALKSQEMSSVVSFAMAEYTQDIQDYQSINMIYQQIMQALQSPENMETQVGRESSLYKAYKAVERMYLLDAKENTYFGLAASSVHFSKKMLAQMANDDNRISGQMVAISLDHPSFDNIKVDVSESEAKDYFKAHKSRYTIRQTEKDVEMAYFMVTPTTEDRINSVKMADSLYSQLQGSSNIKEFTSRPNKIEKIDLKYAQNSKDPYTYNMLGASVVAAYAQVDTNLYLKAGETAIQKRNALSTDPRGYSNHAIAMTPDWQALVTPTSKDSATFIAPKVYNNEIIYFGQVRDIQNRPDSIKIAQLVLPYTTEPKDGKEMTEEQALAKAQEIKAALDGQDSSAMIPYLAEYGTDSVLHPYFLLDGASFDGLGRHIYMANDTMTANWYNELIKTNPNECYIHKRENLNLYTVDMVLYKSAPVAKSQYVLYPVPILASSVTDKSARERADKVSNSTTVEAMTKAAKKNGGEVISTTVTGMQYMVEVNTGILDCREAINWVFSNSKNANNEVGNVSHNHFVGHLTTINPSTRETTVSEVFIVIGITAATEVQDPSFKDMKERVIRDLKAEKKRDAVVERLNKELKSSNMTELAAKYNTAPQQMLVGFSEYGTMESAAVGKIATLTADKTAVVSGNYSAYIVNVTKIEKGADVKKQLMEMYTGQIKSYQQLDDKKAQEEAEKFINMQYTNFAYRTVLVENPQSQQYGGYPLNEVVEQLVYNDLIGDNKIVDHRSRFYGASDNK